MSGWARVAWTRCLLGRGAAGLLRAVERAHRLAAERDAALSPPEPTRALRS
jgi:hypothetical protein